MEEYVLVLLIGVHKRDGIIKVHLAGRGILENEKKCVGCPKFVAYAILTTWTFLQVSKQTH